MRSYVWVYSLGVFFIVGGLVWCGFSKYICLSTCDVQQLHPCFFLFLFVGIIFILCGCSLIMSHVLRNKGKNKKDSRKK